MKDAQGVRIDWRHLDHYCDRPLGLSGVTGGGASWTCPECGKPWRWTSSRFLYPHWESVGKSSLRWRRGEAKRRRLL